MKFFVKGTNHKVRTSKTMNYTHAVVHSEEGIEFCTHSCHTSLKLAQDALIRIREHLENARDVAKKELEQGFYCSWEFNVLKKDKIIGKAEWTSKFNTLYNKDKWVKVALDEEYIEFEEDKIKYCEKELNDLRIVELEGR